MGADDRVQIGTLSKARFEKLESAYGLNLNRHGLLAAEDLRLTMQDGVPVCVTAPRPSLGRNVQKSQR